MCIRDSLEGVDERFALGDELEDHVVEIGQLLPGLRIGLPVVVVADELYELTLGPLAEHERTCRRPHLVVPVGCEVRTLDRVLRQDGAEDQLVERGRSGAVSYTHLTLPTIL